MTGADFRKEPGTELQVAEAKIGGTHSTAANRRGNRVRAEEAGSTCRSQCTGVCYGLESFSGRDREGDDIAGVRQPAGQQELGSDGILGAARSRVRSQRSHPPLLLQNLWYYFGCLTGRKEDVAAAQDDAILPKENCALPRAPNHRHRHRQV